jgi:AcrR family transcriptional regulator
MPLLINTETRTDELVLAINHLLAQHGPTGLTLRRIAGASGVHTSSMLHHYGSREHLLRVAAGRTGRARAEDLEVRLPREGVAALLPYSIDDLPDARAWLAWQEMWRSEERLVSTIDHFRDEERFLLARALQLRFVSDDLDGIVALADGLLVALCRPQRPMSLTLARGILTRYVEQLLPGIDVTPGPRFGSTR